MLISYRQEWTFHITVVETYSQWLSLLLHNLHECTFNEYIWQLKDNINHLLQVKKELRGGLKVPSGSVKHLISKPCRLRNRIIRPEVFCKKSSLRNFAKFTGKHLFQSLFFNKVASLTRGHFSRSHSVQKRDLANEIQKQPPDAFRKNCSLNVCETPDKYQLSATFKEKCSPAALLK